jgi:hypothetical protein
VLDRDAGWQLSECSNNLMKRVVKEWEHAGGDEGGHAKSLGSNEK